MTLSIILDATRKKKDIFIKDVVKKECSDSDVEATEALKTDRSKARVCDRDKTTFYHSEQGSNGNGVQNPYLTLNLNGNYRITTITVVNVHSGAYCRDEPMLCVKRLDGALIEVLAGKKKSIFFSDSIK